jgi:hypothetical protein
MKVTDRQLVLIAQAHQRQLLTIREAAAATVGRLWDRFMTGPEDRAANQFVTAASATLASAQPAAVLAALNFVATYTSAATDTPPPAAVTELDPAPFLRPRGADIATSDVLRRSVIQFRSDLGNGAPFIQAKDSARARVVQTARTEPMLSARAATSEAMKTEPRIVGYRRVPDAGACTFCLLISTRRYRDSELSPVHPGCGCTVAPIIADRDPGEVLDTGLVSQLMSADPALGRRGDARGRARDVSATIHEHGELGPTVYPSGVEFTAA